MTIEFFHECVPPTATAQQRRHGANGRTWQTGRASKAKATFIAILERHAPEKPMQGPIAVNWCMTFPHTGKTSARAESGTIAAIPKETRPDLDNLSKLLLDAATTAGYWEDDARIAMLSCSKFNGDVPGLYFRVSTIETHNSIPTN